MKKYIIAIAFIAVVALQVCSFSALAAENEEKAQEVNKVTDLRFSLSKDKLRLVIDLTKSPLYQIYSQGPTCLVVELLNTAWGGKTTLKAPPSSSLVSSWSIDAPNINKFRWTINLKSPLPREHYQVLKLKNPNRLVVDIDNAWNLERSYELTDGVSWLKKETVGGKYGYLLWNQLVFDPFDRHIKLDIGLAKDNLNACETVSSQVKRLGALAGINGGYFYNKGGPLGLVVKDGEVLCEHVSRRPARTALAITDDQKITFSRLKAANGTVKDLAGNQLDNVILALGGGPSLLKQGSFNLTTDLEELGPKGNDITRPCGRTALGVTSKGKMVMACMSGYKSSHSQGVKLEEMARLMFASGCQDAMNLDGGGSVDMAINGNIVANGPGASTYERPVANTLLIFDDRPQKMPDTIRLSIKDKILPADGQSETTLTATILTKDGQEVPDGTLVEFFTDNLSPLYSAVTKNGKVKVVITSAVCQGLAQITAKSGYAKATANLILSPGPASVLTVGWNEKKTIKDTIDTFLGNTPDKRTILAKILVEDLWHNGIKNISVDIKLEGKTIGVCSTQDEGQVTVEVDLPLDSKNLTFEVPGLTPVSVTL